jgi:hypothetical protein
MSYSPRAIHGGNLTLQWTRAVFASLPALLLPSYREKRQSPIACGERNVDSTHPDGTTISSPNPVISLSGGNAGSKLDDLL